MNAIHNHRSMPMETSFRDITIDRVRRITALLENGESMEVVIALLDARATNKAIRKIASQNKMSGHHRKDFHQRTMEILERRL